MAVAFSLSQCRVQQFLLKKVPAVFFRLCIEVLLTPSAQHKIMTELGVPYRPLYLVKLLTGVIASVRIKCEGDKLD